MCRPCLSERILLQPIVAEVQDLQGVGLGQDSVVGDFGQALVGEGQPPEAGLAGLDVHGGRAPFAAVTAVLLHVG